MAAVNFTGMNHIFQTKSLGDSAALLWSCERGLPVCLPFRLWVSSTAEPGFGITQHIGTYRAVSPRQQGLGTPGQQLLRPSCRNHSDDKALPPLTHQHPQQSRPASSLRLHQAERKSCLACAIFSIAGFSSYISAIAVRFINTEVIGCHFYLLVQGY